MSDELSGAIRTALITELEQLRDAVRAVSEPLSEEAFWTRPIDPGNSVGHLVLHLTGNLNHFVGAQLGHTGYLRDRDREFNETEQRPRETVLAGLDEAVATFRRVVEDLPEARLLAPHPETRLGPVLNGLVHLLTHFAMHRGQMSYIIRLLNT